MVTSCYCAIRDKVRTTLNMHQRKAKKQTVSEMTMKIIEKYVKRKAYESISKQIDVPVSGLAR